MALRLTTAIPITSNVTSYDQYRHRHNHGCACASYTNKSSSSNLHSRRPMIMASKAHPARTTNTYLQQKQVEFFIHPLTTFPTPNPDHNQVDQILKEEEEMVVAKLRLVAAAAADRAEMHGVLAEQRDGWNKLFHDSLTSITLAAIILQALPNNNTNAAATLLYGASTALMCGVNKLQPSQLAEEQRMAARLFRQLNTDIHTNLALPPHLRQEQSAESFLSRAYAAVLALDKAYPLPLFPGMLDKFPQIVEPAVWWEEEEDSTAGLSEAQTYSNSNRNIINGWSAELEKELRGLSEMLRSGDIAEFVGLSRKVLQANTILAIAGPLLTGIAGALNLNNSCLSMSMVAGVLGVVANTVSHGGQVGMVFEMYRNCAGFYHFLDSSISATLHQSNPEMRENGELFKWRMALKLGRAPHSPLSDSSSKFAGKLF